MPSISQRILDYLHQHPEGADDDELTTALGLKRRQQVNIRCRQLANQQLLARQKLGGKIRNIAIGQSIPVIKIEPEDISARPWFWEGHVQTHVAQYLRERGYTILRTANTATHEHGKDIEAEKDSRPVWVTVKGYPRDTARTHATMQAAHWFKDAMFDIIVWRGLSAEAYLILALPDFPRYHRLLAKVAWLQPVIRFNVVWVGENGSVWLEMTI